MYKFVSALNTYGGLNSVDALLNSQNLPATTGLCIAYLKAVEALWFREAMHQLLQDEDARLRAHVNDIVKTVGSFVTVSFFERRLGGFKLTMCRTDGRSRRSTGWL